MTKGLRCPNCGAIPNFHCIDHEGRTFYKCSMGMTTFGEDGGRTSYIVSCDTIVNSGGVTPNYTPIPSTALGK